MNTTVETPTTIDELRERLERERGEVEAAKAVLGAAALDTADPRKASKRVTDAESAVQATSAALAELERRDAVEARRQAELAAAHDRQQTYEWAARYMAGVIEVQRAQEAVKAAAERLGEAANGVTRAIGVVKRPGTGRALGWDIDTLDQGLIRSLPNGQKDRFPIHGFSDLPEKGWRLSPDQCEERIVRARELADQEAARIAEHRRST